MIFDYMNIGFSDDEWIEIIKEYLAEWTEIPLSTNGQYNKDDLRFFDGLLGTLLKQTEYFVSCNPHCLNKKFVESWKYQGKLYRVMHEHMVWDSNGNRTVVMPEVEYHGMITHWTDDYTFKGILHFIDNCIGSSENSTLFNVTSDFSHEQSTAVSVAMYMDLGEDVVSDVLTPKIIKILDSQRDKNNKLTLTSM